MTSPNRAARVAAAAAVGYLAGTFPSADLATRAAARGADLRAQGSGNPGALNAAAVLGRRWGLAVLGADMAKGALAGVAGRAIGGDAGAYAAATSRRSPGTSPPCGRDSGEARVWPRRPERASRSSPRTSRSTPLVAATSAVASQRAETSIQVSCAVWTAAALVWWRRGLPNAWGPKPGPGLPAFAAVSSTMILSKFRARPEAVGRDRRRHRLCVDAAARSGPDRHDVRMRTDDRDGRRRPLSGRRRARHFASSIGGWVPVRA